MNELIENFRQMVWLDDPLGLLVNLVILALFALGSFDVVRAMMMLAGERRRIDRARGRLQSGQCPKDSPSSVIEFLGVPERGLLGRRIARVMQLRGAGVGQRNLLRRLTAERLEGY